MEARTLQRSFQLHPMAWNPAVKSVIVPQGERNAAGRRGRKGGKPLERLIQQIGCPFADRPFPPELAGSAGWGKAKMKSGIQLLLAWVLLFTAANAHTETVAMATGEWIPFTSSNLENYGEFTERVGIVFSEMGKEPAYRFYPWPRCFDAVIHGRVWAAFPYSYTEERSEKVLYSDPLSCSKTVFFYYEKDTPKMPFGFNRLEDLQPYRIGGVSGYFYEESFRKAGLNVDYANQEISGLEKLKRGRVDLMPVNESVGRHLIRTHFPDDVHHFKTLIQPLSVEPLHLIVSKKYPKSESLLENFNAALKACREKGLVHIPECR